MLLNDNLCEISLRKAIYSLKKQLQVEKENAKKHPELSEKYQFIISDLMDVIEMHEEQLKEFQLFS